MLNATEKVGNAFQTDKTDEVVLHLIVKIRPGESRMMNLDPSPYINTLLLAAKDEGQYNWLFMLIEILLG